MDDFGEVHVRSRPVVPDRGAAARVTGVEGGRGVPLGCMGPRMMRIRFFDRPSVGGALLRLRRLRRPPLIAGQPWVPLAVECMMVVMMSQPSGVALLGFVRA